MFVIDLCTDFKKKEPLSGLNTGAKVSTFMWKLMWYSL